MTKIDVVLVAIKIFGLYYVTQLVQHIIQFIFMMSGSGSFYEGIDMIFYYGGIFFTLIIEGMIAYLAILRSEWIVSKVIKENTAPAQLNTDKTDLIEIALAIIGVVAVTHAIPELLSQVVEMVYFRDRSIPIPEIWTKDNRSQFFLSIFTLSTGLFLIMNARNFADKIAKAGKSNDES